MSTLMKRHLTALLAAAAVGATMATADGPAQAASTTQLPFRAEFAGTITPPQGPPPVTLTGAGEATYLGSMTSTGGAAVIGQAATCPDGGWLIQQDHVLTSTDGTDQISLTIRDQSCMSGPGTIHGAGTYAVTGGTGRFSAATGQGSFEGDGDFARGTFVITLSGTISRPSGR